MNIIDRLLSVIAPNDCLNCWQESSVLCADCVLSMTDVPSSCYRCHKATRNYRSCPDHSGKYYPNHIYMAVEYKGLAKELVKAYKFNQKREAADIMAEHLNQILPYYSSNPTVTYVPTSGAHIRERGYDHAKLIAKELARLRGYNYATMLVRTSSIKQIGATRKERMTQLKNVLRPTNTKLYKNKHILLIDDVVTTGATLEACAKVLKQNGIGDIDAAVFARTPKLVNSK